MRYIILQDEINHRFVVGLNHLFWYVYIIIVPRGTLVFNHLIFKNMENLNNVEKRTFEFDEIQELVNELKFTLKMNEKLDTFDLLQEYSKRNVYLPTDVGLQKEINLVLNCYTTLRRAIYRFKSIYEV
jgi:hypothetical protein